MTFVPNPARLFANLVVVDVDAETTLPVVKWQGPGVAGLDARKPLDLSQFKEIGRVLSNETPTLWPAGKAEGRAAGLASKNAVYNLFHQNGQQTLYAVYLPERPTEVTFMVAPAEALEAA